MVVVNSKRPGPYLFPSRTHFCAQLGMVPFKVDRTGSNANQYSIHGAAND
jgi:hypothetical protein